MLVLGILAFYLQDSAQLLYWDELVATRSAGAWRISLGELEVAGRYLFIPNPLAPWRLLFRANWMATSPNGFATPPAQLLEFSRPIRPLGVGCALLALLLLVALPAALLKYPYAPLLLALLIGCYVLIAMMALYMLRARARLRLTRKDIASLTIGALLCPPHAINLLRRISLMHSPEDALHFAAATLADAERDELRRVLEGRIDLLESAGDASRSSTLRDGRQRIGVALQ
jgi:hypothetical protein